MRVVVASKIWLFAKANPGSLLSFSRVSQARLLHLGKSNDKVARSGYKSDRFGFIALGKYGMRWEQGLGNLGIFFQKTCWPSLGF